MSAEVTEHESSLLRSTNSRLCWFVYAIMAMPFVLLFPSANLYMGYYPRFALQNG